MRGFTVIKDKKFYDFKQKEFVEIWNTDCRSQNENDIQQFLNNEEYKIILVPLWINGYEIWGE